MFLRSLSAVTLLAGITVAHAEDIVIAQVASPTHPVTKLYAEGLSVGFNTFFAGINAKGGINGKKVVLSVKDDHYNPDETVSLAKESIQDPKTVALFGTVGTGNLGALLKTKMLQDNSIALIGPASGIPAHLAAPNVFPIRASYTDQLIKVGKHTGTISRQRIAFLHIDTPLAPDLKKALQAGMEENKAKLVSSVEIVTTPDPAQMDQNVRTALEKAEAAQPDTFVIFGPGSVTPSAIKAIRKKFGQSVMIYALISPPPAQLIPMIGIENASGLIIPQLVPLPSDNQLQIVKEYLADLAKYAPNEKPSGLTLEGYLGARVLYEGLKKAGPHPTRATLTTALNDLGKVNVDDFQVDYSPAKKGGYKAVEMTMINKGGRLIH